MIPFDNEGDLDDVPDAVRDAIRFHPVHDVREVLAIALEDGAAKDTVVENAAA